MNTYTKTRQWSPARKHDPAMRKRDFYTSDFNCYHHPYPKIHILTTESHRPVLLSRSIYIFSQPILGCKNTQCPGRVVINKFSLWLGWRLDQLSDAEQISTCSILLTLSVLLSSDMCQFCKSLAWMGWGSKPCPSASKEGVLLKHGTRWGVVSCLLLLCLFVVLHPSNI